jgi:uncharacterized protein (DUF2235 family)
VKKNIVVCADGTWNHPEQASSDCISNVLKVSRRIKSQTGQHAQQVFYDWGLGSYHAPISAGVTGRGLDKNVLDAYRYIVHNYDDDSQLFLFGFSRGAYTVRALCGLINNVGIIKACHGDHIHEAWQIYKSTHRADHPKGERALAFRERFAHATMRIRFVGVWDTVGALGIPFSLLGWMGENQEFYDTKLSSNIEIARHALAIDERRQDFAPALWHPHPRVDLKQMWFAGVHSDVGGGYPNDENGLNSADAPLAWLLNEASDAGLFVEPFYSPPSDALPKLHKSRRHVFRVKRPLVRELAIEMAGTGLHRSVLERWQRQPSYRPPQLQALLDKTELDQLPWCD